MAKHTFERDHIIRLILCGAGYKMDSKPLENGHYPISQLSGARMVTMPWISVYDGDIQIDYLKNNKKYDTILETRDKIFRSRDKTEGGKNIRVREHGLSEVIARNNQEIYLLEKTKEKLTEILVKADKDNK